MAELKRRRRSTGRDETGQRIVARPEWAGLVVFALLMTLAPLAFGAVDQAVQIGLLVLLAVGLALRPPSIVRPSPRTGILLGTLAILLLAKEFAPAALFGSTKWRTLMVESFHLELPWTHHPEPGRAVDALLCGALAILWLLWVRTLAAKRENRLWLAWSLAAASALVAAVSFYFRMPKDPTAIFGLRYTPGWIGFGPFPNRNHTACFFAMGTVMSCGVLIWEIARRHTLQAAVAAVFALTSLAGVLATQSRGGVIGLTAGLAIYGGLCLAKFRDRRALGSVIGISLVGLTVALVGGNTLFSRFSSPASNDSNNGRVAIWGEALKMWSDAPLLGHGAGSFASIFPLYANLQLDNEIVIHPESSWLQWLDELGIVPVALAVVVVGAWAFGRARTAMGSHRSFFLYAGGFATCAVLLCHGAIDVPAHRWATAAYALAALGLASPRPKIDPKDLAWNAEAPPIASARWATFLPLAVALFWALPLFADWPTWSPLSLQRELVAAETTEDPSAGLARVLPHFPLNSQLHELIGAAELRAGAPEASWRSHFELADRLSPGFWGLPMAQARAAGRRFPEAAFHFWQLALERSGRRSSEVFNLAYEETRRLPKAQETWAAYVETHAVLALDYALRVPREEARQVFVLWWQERGSDREVMLTEQEIQKFYQLAPAYSDAEALGLFMQARPALAARDFYPYAKVLHAFGDDVRAWQLLSTRRRDFEWPPPHPGMIRSDLERRVSLSPNSGDGAQALAAYFKSEGDDATANDIVLAFAQKPAAPAFFTRKSAYILQARGQLTEAVEMMLREVE